jgi:group I intron endonuclease
MIPTKLPKSGLWIYLIINLVNDKVYVGKTKNPWSRCHQYLSGFREQSTHRINQHLLNAFSKYGIEQFLFRVWEICDTPERLAERELFWIDLFKTTSRDKGYNLRRDSSTGMVTHPETSEKIRKNLARQYANGQRAGHGEKMVAKWAESPERRTAQGKLFSRIKTKYRYVISDDYGGQETADYIALRERGLASVLSSFHRSGLNVAHLKGYKIERVPACRNIN